jgi:exopolysaccharide production protein ExoZ
MSLGLLRGILALTLFFLVAIVSGFFLDTSQPAIHVLTNTLLIEFLLGVWIGFAVVLSVRISNRLSNVLLALALAGFLAGIAFGYTRLPSAVTWGVPSALLLAGLVFRESNGCVPFVIKNCSFLGDSSYSLYLLHIVLIDAAMLLAIYLDGSVRIHVSLIGTSGMMIVCFLITAYCVAVAYISYELIERRVVGRLQDLYRRKIAAAPAALT